MQKTDKCTVRDYSNAKKARELKNIIGRLDYVDKNMIPNCPVTIQDILSTEDIFGPNIGSLKGKTMRNTQEDVKINIHDVPPEIMERHRDVILAVDIMFIKKIPFVIFTSFNIHFGTSELVMDMKNKK